MPKVTFVAPDGVARSVEGEAGFSVMEVAVRNGIAGIEAECGGACACATCHVYVDEDWLAALPAPEATERDMLDFATDVRPNSRLACQLKLTPALDGLSVQTPVQLG